MGKNWLKFDWISLTEVVDYSKQFLPFKLYLNYRSVFLQNINSELYNKKVTKLVVSRIQ